MPEERLFKIEERIARSAIAVAAIVEALAVVFGPAAARSGGSHTV